MPSRTIFYRRTWPETYSFPACLPCNDLTRQDEQLIAVLTRVWPDARNDEEGRELRAALRGLANNLPQLAARMISGPVSETTLMRVRRKFGLTGTDADIGALNTDDPEISARVLRWSGKLACALHYLHSERALPSAAAIDIRWFTNAQLFLRGGIPESVIAMAQGMPRLERARQPLGDQFTYRFGVNESGSLGLYVCSFRQALAFVAMVFAEAADQDHPPGLH